MKILSFLLFPVLQRGATIVYATHIFDGLETWATHLAYIQDGELKKCSKLSDIKEMKSADNLLSVVETWLRSEVKAPKKAAVNCSVRSGGPSPFDGSPFRSSRHMAYYR
jgi:CCR4-NOT complex subunit CAF16